MNLQKLEIPGVCLIDLPKIGDDRGNLIKGFQKTDFQNLGLSLEVRESYVVTSHKNVLRGMKIQIPPHALSKSVSCIRGRVLDVALDLRNGSPTEGKSLAIEMNGEKPQLLVMPEGIAHGYYVFENDSQVLYYSTREFSPEHDRGIRYDSFGFQWPAEKPFLKEKDLTHPSLEEFQSDHGASFEFQSFSK